MQQAIGRGRVLAGMVLILALVIGPFSGWRLAGAQYYTDLFLDAPYPELAGIEEAVQRRYMGPSSSYVNIFANIARFDSVENAALGLEAINAYVLEAFAMDASPIAFEPVDSAASVPDARAYVGFLDLGADTPPYGEGGLVQAQVDAYVYTVAAIDYYGDGTEGVVDEISLEAAIAMIEALIAAPAGLATPAVADTPATSGLWAKFPVQNDRLPQQYGVTSTADDVIIAPPAPATPELAGGYYGIETGLIRVAGRQYESEQDESGGESAPALTGAYIEVATFDGSESAEAGFPVIRDNVVAEIEGQGISFDEAGSEVEADEAGTYVASLENEGEHVTIVLVIARSGPYVVIVGVAGADEDEVVGAAADLTQAVIDAEAGDGEETWNWDGTSTGGIWDMFPPAGDEVLRGLVPWDDQELYP